MPTSTTRFSWRTAMLLALLVAAAYGASLRNEFVFDDLMFIKDDPRVKSFAKSPRLFVEALWGYADEQDGRPKIHQYYRPLQTFPLAVSHFFFGAQPWPAHLLNLVVHWLNCLMVFALFRAALDARSSPRADPRAAAALVATALFAVHPGYSEAILWVSDIAGLGAGFCILMLVLLHASSSGRRWFGLLATPVLYLCGLWFKESGALAPAFMLLFDLVLAPDRGPRRACRLRWRYLLMVPPLAVYFWLRSGALGGLLPGLHVVTLSRWEMVINAVGLIPEFVRAFVWPFDLNMYHDFNAVSGLGATAFVQGAAVLAAGALVFVLSVRRHPPIAFGVAWALIAASPHLLIRWPQLNVFAERYLYLPAVGLFLIVAYGIDALSVRLTRPSLRVAGGGVVAVIVLFIVVDNRRIPDWHDDETIYATTVKQSPRAELIRSNLAIKYLEAGRYDDGITLMQEVIAVDPTWNDAWYNLASLYLAKGEDELALEAFEKAKERDPYKAATLLNLGYLHDRRGEREAAIDSYLRLVEVDSRNADGWYNLALVAIELGQVRNARTAIDKVLDLTPGNADARRISQRVAFMKLSQRLGGAPERPDTVRRCNEAKRQIDAKQFAAAVARLNVAAWYDEASPLPHQYLANAYYLQGRLKKATQHQREALLRDPGNELYAKNLDALEKALAAN